MGILDKYTNESINKGGEITAGEEALVIAVANESMSDFTLGCESIIEIEEDVVDMNHGVLTLEGFKDLLIESTDESEGGLDVNSAKAVSIGVTSTCERLGVQEPNQIVMGFESFKDANTRVKNTNYSVEGIKETIIKIIEAIRKAGAALFDRIMSMFGNAEKTGAKIEAAGKALEAKVGGIDKKAKPTKGMYEDKAAAVTFGGVVEAVDILASHEELAGKSVIIAKEMKEMSKAIDASTKEVEDLLKDKEKKGYKKKAKALRAEIISGITSTMKSSAFKELAASKLNRDIDVNGFTVYGQEGLIKDQSLVILVPKDDVDATKPVISVRISQSPTASQHKEMKVDSIGDLKKLAKAVVSLGKAIKKSGEAQNEVKSFQKAIDNNLKSLARLSKSISEDSKSTITNIQKITSAVMNGTGKILSTSLSLNNAASKAAVSLVNKQASMYKVEKK